MKVFPGMLALLSSPDGSSLILRDRRLLDIRTGKTTALPNADPLWSFSWLDSATLAGIVSQGTEEKPEPSRLSLYDREGKLQKQVLLDTKSWARWDIRSISRHPILTNILIAAEYTGNSTTGADHIYHRVDLETGKSKQIAEGKFLVWAPDGKRFCTAPGRDLKPLGKRKDGTTLTVWFAPLRLHDIEGKILRTLTPDMVWVTGCDWRKQSH